jgi:hypothetical protein
MREKSFPGGGGFWSGFIVAGASAIKLVEFFVPRVI